MKQAPWYWNKKIHAVLDGELGFTRSNGDPYLYVKWLKEGVTMFELDVGDILLVPKTTSQISWMKKMVSERFEMKDMGRENAFLGLEITPDRNKKKLWLTKKVYIEKILDQLGISDRKPVANSMEDPNQATNDWNPSLTMTKMPPMFRTARRLIASCTS